MLDQRLVTLNAKQAIIALILILIVVGCFTAQAYQHRIFEDHSTEEIVQPQVSSGITSSKTINTDQYCMLFIPITLMAQKTQSLTNSTCMQIYDFVNENPGIQFRAICAGLCLPIGLVQYYVNVLTKAGLISFIRDGRYKRFFVSKKFSKQEMAAISALRHKTVKKIVEVLLSEKQLSHYKLASEVSITPQALTWQIRALKSTKYILRKHEGVKTIYFLDELLAPLLQKYLTIAN
jgi:DNA-binding transcriptional ArsR family regulator